MRLWDQVLQEVHFDQVLHPGQADLEGQGILCLPCLPSYHQGQLHHQGHPSVRRVQVNLAVLVNLVAPLNQGSLGILCLL